MPLVQYLQGEFEKADRNVKPDPGRVTARRLNRNEYSNTIRDLLGVDFRAEKRFPHRRSRLRLRQHRRRPDHLAGADGEVPGRRRRASPPAPSAPTRCRSRSKSQYHRQGQARSAASISAPSKPPTASISTANTSSASACRASAAPTPSRSRWASGWTASCSTPCRWKPSRPSWSTSIRTRKSRCASILPEGDHVFRAGFVDDDFVKTA